MYKQFIDFVKSIYGTQDFIPLHPPLFQGKEKEYLIDCIDSTFVSYVGKYVTKFEEMTAEFTGAKYAVAVVNGTAALQIALQVAGVKHGDEVITQPLTFVATANAISHCGAYPTFVDVDNDTLGMGPKSLESFLAENCLVKDDGVYNKLTNRKITAIVPMHTFGHPCKIDKIIEIADRYNIPVVEDAAESLGSFYKGKHTGTFGKLGIISFNGNKIVTSGGGGVILTSDEELAKKAKHLTTTAKVPHKWEYYHDEIGYNYRMPNLNASLLLAQLENLEKFVKIKRDLAMKYKEFFDWLGVEFFTEPEYATSNYWLNAIFLRDRKERDEFLEFSHENGVLCRPAWVLMNKLPMYKDCFSYNLENAYKIEERLVNIPSGAIL
jgi:aminotransferase in exopolysaccharide biosynthesis